MFHPSIGIAKAIAVVAYYSTASSFVEPNNSVLTGQIFTKLDIDVVLIKHRYRKNSSTEFNLDHGRIVLQGIFHVPLV